MKIVLAGDVCSDKYIYTYSDRSPRNKQKFDRNWKSEKNTKEFCLPGGVELIQHFLSDPDISLVIPDYKRDKVLQSLAILNKDTSKKDNTGNRISKFLGYTRELEITFNWNNCNTEGADIYIIDDAGNDFRFGTQNWNPLMESIKENDCVLYKVSWPIFNCKNWLMDKVLHKNIQDLIFLIDIDDLRDEGVLQIDDDIIRAMIFIPEYKHGSRSLSSILEMSTLEGKRFFDKSALPSNIQLKLHADDEIFQYILTMDECFHPYFEKIGRSVHENYLKNTKVVDPKVNKQWDDLPVEYKKSNIEQARDNFLKLARIGCLVEKDSKKIGKIEFTDTEKWILAEWEHKRWNRDKLLNGWSYGPDRDDNKKSHPDLLPWHRLSEEAKNKDVNVVESITKTVNDNGLSVRKN